MAVVRDKVEETETSLLSQAWSLQQEQIGQLQGQISELQNQLQEQSTYCTSLGAILGHLLWKTSRINKVVTVLSSSNRMRDFLSTVGLTLHSFMNTYKHQLPSQESDECQMVMALVGIVSNLAAGSDGRQFLATDESGKDTITHLVSALGKVPVPSGNCLKRLMYMALYNICINNTGMRFVREQPQLITAIAETLNDDEEQQELQVTALRLLQSLVWEEEGQGEYKRTYEIPKPALQKFAQSNNADLRMPAAAILTSLNTFELSGDKQDVKITEKCRSNCTIENEN